MPRSTSSTAYHPLMVALIWSFRVLLAGLFIFAAVGKIQVPHEFAAVIRKFHVLPRMLSNLPAMILPWVELLASLGLVTGVLRRASLAWITLLLAVFTLLFVRVMALGILVDCGCFGILQKYVPLLAGDVGFGTLSRNLVLLGLCAFLWFAPAIQARLSTRGAVAPDIHR